MLHKLCILAVDARYSLVFIFQNHNKLSFCWLWDGACMIHKLRFFCIRGLNSETKTNDFIGNTSDINVDPISTQINWRKSIWWNICPFINFSNEWHFVTTQLPNWWHVNALNWNYYEWWRPRYYFVTYNENLSCVIAIIVGRLS